MSVVYKVVILSYLHTVSFVVPFLKKMIQQKSVTYQNMETRGNKMCG